ncbi:MAG: ABC1 kinase family protein [bacterium]|jgi:ubiquinone biosynthesis protein
MKGIRHLHRYREIVACLVRNGFGYVVEELGLFGMLSLPKKLFSRPRPEEEKAMGVRVRRVLEELGPTFIKLGQMLSTRPDLLPDSIIKELNQLQDQVPPSPWDEVREIIGAELGGQVEELFAYFSREPLAAASIGQVHRAKLKTGEEVVVKVQRPRIGAAIETDLEILGDLAALAEYRLEVARYYRVRDIVAEFSRSLRGELNYLLEARNGERFAAHYARKGQVAVPKVYWDYTTRRVITLEYFRGVKISDTEALVQAGFDPKKLAGRLLEVYLHQVLVVGFFHGDPHPGNILVLPGGVLAFTDFGLMGRLNRRLRREFLSLLAAVIGRNTGGMVRAILRIGRVGDDFDPEELQRDVEKLQEKYFDLPLDQISIGEALYDFFRLGYRHRIQIPADLAIMGKAFLTLEGVVEKLDSQVSVASMLLPLRDKLLRARLEPRELVGSLWRRLLEYGELFFDFPTELRDLILTLKRGRLRFEFDRSEIKLIIRHLDRIGNRLSFSIVLLSFSIIMTGLIIGSSLVGQPVLFGVPAIEVGFIIAALMFFWLLFSIFRSGRF